MSTVPRPERTCQHTGCRALTTKRGLCATHYREYSARNLAQLHATRDKRERAKRYGTAWRTQRARILNRDGNACVYCGISERLEVHHLTDTTTPRDHELVTLCYRHHRAIEAEGKRGQVGKVGNAITQWIHAAGGA